MAPRDSAGTPLPGTERTSLVELAWLFGRLGATAFGGPAAHIAMMREEVVRRRAWMDDARFLDLIAATNLIPGPNSTELALHVGWERRRGPGLLVAGAAFILPAALVSAGLGWVYVRYGSLPDARWLLRGLKPAILAIVVQAIVGLVPVAARTPDLRWLALLAGIAAALGVDELVVLGAAGAIAWLVRKRLGPRSTELESRVAPILGLAGVGATASQVTVGGIFGVFFKIGSILFGSGYVLLAFLRSELVERLGWMDHGQVLDAVAVGQITPGPVFSTATFIGYLLSGPMGAAAATVGIFLPAFVLVALSGPLVPRLRASPSARAFLDGLNVASLALMVVVTVTLAGASLVDPVSIAIGVVAALVLVRVEPNPTWLVLGGAVAGFGAHLLGVPGW